MQEKNNAYTELLKPLLKGGGFYFSMPGDKHLLLPGKNILK